VKVRERVGIACSGSIFESNEKFFRNGRSIRVAVPGLVGLCSLSVKSMWVVLVF